MNDLYIEELIDGLQAALSKRGNDLFSSSPNGASLFPSMTSQAKWKFAKGENFLRLHDGQKVYAFKLPTGLSHTEDFAAHREADLDPSVFAEGATQQGLAQVHRADPGSIYFTLQEGRDNPTFTLKHTGESNWRGTPKKRKAKELVVPNIDHAAMAEGIKAAFDGKKEPVKKADFAPFSFAAGPGAHALQRLAFSPGELVHRLGDGGKNNFLGALGAAGLGAGAGAAYHLGKRTLYNTEDENQMEDEQGSKPLLRRMLTPALAAGVIGGAQSSLFDNQYNLLESGAGMGTKVF